jgi:hypothetical protein
MTAPMTPPTQSPALIEPGPTARRTPESWVLNPAVRVLWRARDVVQLELAGHAVTIDGADSALIRALLRPDQFPPANHDPASIDDLRRRGYLVRAPVRQSVAAWANPRLASELTAMAARFGSSAHDRLRARQRTCVAVHGTGRAAVHVAAILAAAGVGRVHVVDAADVRLHHAVPGGLSPGDEGSRFAQAARAAILRAAPDTDTTPLPMGERPDLAVLAIDEPVDTDSRQALHARRCTHLVVRLEAGLGSVGPLVVPGHTSCLACADLHRRDRDPAWTALAVQLCVPRRHGPASDVALASALAGVTAMQALSYLDGGDPATIEATLEMQLPDWRLRRRSWPPHPACDCRAA